MDEPSVDLLEKYRQGDDQAATELFRRYVSRLTVLARARMAPKIARRFDPEDVVLSAYRTFFVRASWVAEAAEAIEHAHRRGIIHCDLKPANLLLDADGHVRVTDFGLATIVTRGAAVRPAIAGTMGYMAPEQLDPAWGPIGPRTDVFGLGAVLFSILAGHAPFSGKSVTELLQNMFETTPLLLLQNHRPDVGPEFNTICRKCLALAPDDRFATAAELAQALRANH